jgi:Ser/Thr protein kinase RdoA (MazF antagonist)
MLLHLTPHPVVARIATATAGVRGPDTRRFLEREVAVAGHVAGKGAPSVPMPALLPPGPFERDGYHLSFWGLVAETPGNPATGAAVGQSLRAVHEALASFGGGDVPVFDPLAESLRILDLLDAAGLFDAADRAMLRRAHDDLLPTYTDLLKRPQQTLHGDAHRGNVLHTATGPVWIDWEDTVVGPVTWDLACHVASSRVVGPAVPAAEEALAAYGPVDADELGAASALGTLLVTCWNLYRADGRPESLAIAERRLAWWRSRTLWKKT